MLGAFFPCGSLRYTGSDLKEVCREAVVAISHAAAAELDKGGTGGGRGGGGGGNRWVRLRGKGEGAERVNEAGGDDDKDRPDEKGESKEGKDEDEDEEGEGAAVWLRPVTRRDLEAAAAKVSASVSERSREAGKVADWNEQYGEIKAKRKRPALSMYL